MNMSAFKQKAASIVRHLRPQAFEKFRQDGWHRSIRDRSLGFGSLSLEMQFRILGIVFIACLLLGVAMVYTQLQNASRGAAYVKVAGNFRLLAVQIQQAADKAWRGDEQGLQTLQTVRKQFNQRLTVLTEGGDIDDVHLFPTHGNARQSLDVLKKFWVPRDALLVQMAALQKPLQLLGGLTATVAERGPAMLNEASTIGGSLPALTGKVLYGVSRFGLMPKISFDNLLPLTKDIADVHTLAPEGGALAEGVRELERQFALLPVDIRPLSALRAAGAGLATDALPDAVDALIEAYVAEFRPPAFVTAIAVLAGSLALTVLVLMVILFNRENIRRRLEAERQRRISETEQETTQHAILRLLNEISSLADGDLTAHATVSDDITGAIAEAVNYAIEELAELVRRVNDAAARVTQTTDRAQIISHELLDAATAQAQEIRGAGARVQATAQSMHQASAAAQDSVDVAHLSLDVARKGAQAVTDSIASMQTIRGQIQETAKRIKRLGESSQEIGEIVALIADITEQTNVLALNAAVQAASAGEAGRGFSLVAEEVQRLAERSAEATRQIASLVRTIQYDTHGAVAAMERSTQGVVAGAGLADSAGQALVEISRVSEELAQRVAAIASATQTQAGNAAQVAAAMQRILDITGQTTRHTQDTALAIAELAELANGLKGSVANFKL
jgi:twitching motility protein PilJ